MARRINVKHIKGVYARPAPSTRTLSSPGTEDPLSNSGMPHGVKIHVY